MGNHRIPQDGWSFAGVGVGMLRGVGDSLNYKKCFICSVVCFLVVWLIGLLVSLFAGFNVSWLIGFKVSWFLGFKTSKFQRMTDTILTTSHFHVFLL